MRILQFASIQLHFAIAICELHLPRCPLVQDAANFENFIKKNFLLRFQTSSKHPHEVFPRQQNIWPRRCDDVITSPLRHDLANLNSALLLHSTGRHREGAPYFLKK